MSSLKFARFFSFNSINNKNNNNNDKVCSSKLPQAILS